MSEPRKDGAAATRVATVRAAIPTDLPAIWELLRELAVYEKLEADVTGSAERLGHQLFGGAWPPVDALVAEVQGRPVGYAIFYGLYSSFWTSPVVWLEDLYVQPAHRGGGLGRDLLREVARIAAGRGCPRVDWAVLDWNEPAIGFYERLGAYRAGGWHTYRLEGKALEAFVAGADHSNMR